MKRVIIVYLGEIDAIPPVRSLLYGLSEQGKEIILIATNSGLKGDDDLRNRIVVKETSEKYEKKLSLLRKYIRMNKLRSELWSLIDSYYDNDSILWITSDVAVKNLGSKLLKYRYVLQLYELIETSYTIPRYRIGNIHLDIYARNAVRVILPEYNRAHISKAWWGLDKLPFVLENKPYYSGIPEERNIEIIHSEQARDILSKLANKKIILYQGIIHKERPLDNFIKAVDELGEDYAFVLMSSGENIYQEINSCNYYFVPFIPAPHHLEITSHAFIGVLSYVPVKTTNSILNAVYCAPNKTFEYSRFSVPMISNDVPALDYMFVKYQCGKCIDMNSINAIKDAILEIENKYDTYSSNARKYYQSVDYPNRIKQLLDEVSS